MVTFEVDADLAKAALAMTVKRSRQILRKDFTITDLSPGDLVLAAPIGDCAIGHIGWHQRFAHPEMDRKPYIVTRSGFSRYWWRPVIAVAGRKGQFCAGCFAKHEPVEGVAELRETRAPEQVH